MLHPLLLADNSGTIIAVMVIGGIIVMAWAVGAVQVKRMNASWSAVAELLGLKFHAGRGWGTPRMKGQVKGIQVEVDTFQKGHGKSKKTFTRVRVSYPSLGVNMSLQKEGFLSTMGKLIGIGRDIEVGDEAFDSTVLVGGRDAEALRAFLTPARRMRIRRFLTNYTQAEISDQSITNITPGIMRNADRLRQKILATATLAWHLTGERAADDNLSEAIFAQEQGRTSDALEKLQQATRSRKFGEPVVAELMQEQPVQAELVEERLLEGELLMLGGRQHEAHQVFQQARQSDPYDEELAEWAEQPTPGPKSDVLEASGPRVEAVPEHATSALSAAELCRELFEGNSTSYQANHTFEQKYAGTPIAWSGKLKRAESYTYDFIFGNDPGCRASLVVHELDTITYGDSTVSAIIQLPLEALDQLKGKDSATFKFTGKLHKVDALMRNIYVSEARLV